ncbi:MAG TPA: GatB/YqeY domain-containing protein [Terriglobales bacterium]|nr:GatB/YqeY domain-containing protein [Terriglobales bacterium]
MSEVTLKDKLTEAMKEAMKNKEKERLATIRLALSALKQVEVDERITLDDARIIAILDKMVKQRRDSITQYEQGGRQDLADQERYEISVLSDFLPAALTEAEINALIDAAVTETGASGMADMGKLMNVLRPQLQGKADMGAVSALVKAKLAG